MNFNKHLNLEGTHATFGASQWHWINDETLDDSLRRYARSFIAPIGTVLHEYARQRIKHGLSIGKSEKKAIINFLLEQKIPRLAINIGIDYDMVFNNLMEYVNDAIRYNMKPEIVLAYSNYFYGTADAIHFSDKDQFLRIHDLKTGVGATHMEQLDIYAALFCLEYKKKPAEIGMELRIYQNEEIQVYEPSFQEITMVMDKIVAADNAINRIRSEEE